MRLKLETLEKRRDQLAARTIAWGLCAENETVLSGSGDVEVPAQYVELSATLVEALERLDIGQSPVEIKDFLLKAVRKIKAEYQPIENCFSCLFSASPDNLRCDLENLIKSLFDAPFVRANVVPAIRKELELRSFSSQNWMAFKSVQSSYWGEIMQLGLSEGTAREQSIVLDPKNPNKLKASFASLNGREGKHEQSKERFVMPTDKETNEYRRRQLRRRASFGKLLPDLLKKYRGQHVVIIKNHVVASDNDLDRLLTRVRKEFAGQEYYIEEVTDQKGKPIDIDTVEV
jgi:hypothetical protein